MSSNRGWNCRCVLDELAKYNDVGLVSVSGHSRIKDNKTADLFTKEAAGTGCWNRDRQLGVFYLSRRRNKNWLRDQHLKYWRKETKIKCKQVRVLLGECLDKGLLRSIRSLSKTDTRHVTQLLTGLNYHLHKLDRSDTPDCRYSCVTKRRKLTSISFGIVHWSEQKYGSDILGSDILELDQMG
ncbi:uncharacterized protein LOC105836994 [Monomorium pharaonis]|uniref:uncharacterized protein LOC105836994 n=1 Tax=Monomorium pharaonis TaxID=307658 RepID=UPI00063F302A|nr:uncharacterized protein LOC105836994 [Monomorium pharaonis]